MRAMVGEIVAEKSAVWRSLGVAARIVSRSSAKPMSSISSASSRMTTWTPSKREAAALEVVDGAARRRHDDVDAAPQPAQLLADRLAAVDRQDAGAQLAAVAWSASATCIASSRVGTRTSAEVLPSPAFPMGMRWSVGSANAAVLPVPVGASARRSRPASSGGIASRWIGVGSS